MSIGWFMVVGLLTAQSKPDPASLPPAVQKRVDEAITKGVAFLKTAASPAAHHGGGSDELVLWTYVHAGLRDGDPVFKGFLDKMLAAPLERTYNVSLQALILSELDRVKYQGRLLRCAKFLVDNQCVNGQWSYGTPTPHEPRDNDVATDSAARDVPEGKVRKIPVKKDRDGPATGDNSNSQYAALGLRACHDAGIVFPKQVLVLAKQWWHQSQHAMEGRDNGYGGVRGWGYVGSDDPRPFGQATSASMTAGAVGSLCILDYTLRLDWKKNVSVQAGLNWLATHFTLTENFGHPNGKYRHYLYYLYALERAGILYGTEKIGAHKWYAEGVDVLLTAQKPNGSWDTSAEDKVMQPVWDTCFAILFLKRATRPMVASTDRNSPRK